MTGRSSTRLGTAAGVALAAGLLAAGVPLGPRITHALGGRIDPVLTFDVRHADGPVPLDEVGPIWRERLRGYHVGWVRDGDVVRVTVVGAGRRQAEAVRGALMDPGEIEMAEVLNDAPVMRDAFQAARGGRWPGVDAEIDSWRHDDSGRSYDDYFLRAPVQADLEQAVAQLALEPDQRIGLERVEPDPDAEDPRPFWRTYLISTSAVVESRHIAEAIVTFDQYTNAPEVLLTFDEVGRERFADATAAMVGRKLAILRDGAVASAPVIQTEIPGGSASINMGGMDAATKQADAERLVAALRGHGPPLPHGLTATLATVYEPPASLTWAVRLGTAALAGLAAWFLCGLVVRRGWLSSVPGAGRGVPAPLWSVALAIAITIAVPVVLWLAERIHLPLKKDVSLRFQPGLVWLGPWPALLGFAFVEALTLIVSPWRRRRRGAADGRVAIDRAVWFAALGFAVLLAWDRGEVLQQYGYQLGVELMAGATERGVVVLTLVAGAMLYVVGARLITRAGIANGWTVLIGVEALRALWRALEHAREIDGLRVTVAGLAIAGAVVAIALSSQRAGGRRQPGAGLVPLLVIPVIVALHQLPLVRELDERGWLPLELAGLSAPALIAIAALIAAGVSVAGARRLRPAVPSILFAVALAWLGVQLPHRLDAHAELLGAIAGVATADVIAGLVRRIRMGDAVPLVALHDVDAADEHAAALIAAGIPASVEGARTRALLRGLGAFSPVIVRVPASRLDDARRVPSPLHDPLVIRAAAVFE